MKSVKSVKSRPQKAQKQTKNKKFPVPCSTQVQDHVIRTIFISSCPLMLLLYMVRKQKSHYVLLASFSTPFFEASCQCFLISPVVEREVECERRGSRGSWGELVLINRSKTGPTKETPPLFSYFVIILLGSSLDWSLFA